jgi:putative exosortase-associated protein (TIGR04073 family)
MKKFLVLVSTFLLAASAFADIQDPPGNDYGPTRKLGRSISNIFFGITELPETLCTINEREGNSAAASYGIVKGFGRWFFRFGAGWYEFLTFPFPTYKASYRPFYRSNVPWIHGGWTEFPPELGWETRYHYSRTNTAY